MQGLIPYPRNQLKEERDDFKNKGKDENKEDNEKEDAWPIYHHL